MSEVLLETSGLKVNGVIYNILEYAGDADLIIANGKDLELREFKK